MPVCLGARVHVGLVVVGSVAVSEKGQLPQYVIHSSDVFMFHFSHLNVFFPGYRIGKGEGFADMEYAMMVSMGAVNESTVVVTVVHDCQVKTFNAVLIKQRC